MTEETMEVVEIVTLAFRAMKARLAERLEIEHDLRFQIEVLEEELKNSEANAVETMKDRDAWAAKCMRMEEQNDESV